MPQWELSVGPVIRYYLHLQSDVEFITLEGDSILNGMVQLHFG